MTDQPGYFLIEGLEIWPEPRDRLPVGPLAAYATARDDVTVIAALVRVGFRDADHAVLRSLDAEALVREHGAAAALSQRGLLAGWTSIVAWPAQPYPGAPVMRWFVPDRYGVGIAPARAVAGWTPVGGRMALVAFTPREEAKFNAPR